MKPQEYSNMFMPQEEQEQVEEVATTLSKLEVIVKSAKECLNIDKFHNYKDQYMKEESNMLGVMIAYTNSFILEPNGNPGMYGMRMAMYVQKLYDLRRLLRSVEIDAAKKEK